MATGYYKLRLQQWSRSFLADVTVSAERAKETSIEISNDAFAWLKDEYGPDAFEWSVCDDYRRSAAFGAEYALAHTASGPVRASIAVTRIDAHPAHSDGDCVAYACCFATWTARGVQGTHEPTVGPGGIDFKTDDVS